MGTRWRGLLAPINMPTGDGRRMANGAIEWRELPLGLKWQRQDDMGHDASVIVGSTDVINIGTTAQAISSGWISAAAAERTGMPMEAMGAWGGGELFTDADTAALPRLAQDVAEVMLLLDKGVVGPSVDAGAAEFIFVREGTDEPLTDADWEELMWDEIETGEPAPIEMLFTQYQIAAATLVAVPAFAECQPFEVYQGETALPEPALIAALTAAAQLVVPGDVFAAPDTAPAWQLLTVEAARPGERFRRVSGYAAPFGTCHAGFRNVCHQAPTSATSYALFHRHPVNTSTGLIGAGRLTTGFGKAGTGCTHLMCRNNDDHACSHMTLTEAMAHYDALTTVGHVVATEYAGAGIWVQGYVDDTDEAVLSVLSRQKCSGDWRDHGGRLELIELLALAREEPGFPIPRVGLTAGRQTSLTAAAMPQPTPAPATVDRPPASGWDRLADRVVDGVVERLRPRLADDAPALTAAAPMPDPDCEPGEPGCEDMPMPAAVEHTGAMVALRMTDDDAARLAVDGGEVPDELHLTLLYLGEGADIDANTRQAIIDACTTLAAEWQTAAAGDLQLVGDGFSVNVFNPMAEDKETCIVLGVSGEQIAAAHQQVLDAVSAVFGGYPAQHQPFVAHVTLAYTDDLSLVQQLTSRTGDVTFDRLRVSFAGAVHDIPLNVAPAPVEGEEPPNPAGETEPATAAALIDEVEAALAAVDADERARTAAVLAREIEEVASGL